MPTLTGIVRLTLEVSWLLVGLMFAHRALAQAPESPGTPSSSVTVIAPRPPTPQELAGEAVHDFVEAHARPVAVTGQLARWRIPICPVTDGLPKALNEFVSARILAVAASVGAPYQTEESCKSRRNVYVFFTAEPTKLLDQLEKQDARLLGFHYRDESRNLKKLTRPVQGFYVTASRGVRGDTSIDEAYPVLPVFGATVLMDLMTPGCGREIPTSVTSGDLAFLRGLYHTNMELVVGMERSTIAGQMRGQFDERHASR